MIAVTGATGHLGQHVIKELLKQGTNPKEIIAIVRDKNKAQEFASKGIEVREANYTSADSLDKALKNVDKLLLISGNELGQRLTQHTNVINAAKRANVKLVAYTSILKADTSKMILAAEHLGTEKVLQASGIPYVILRNGWYIENYTDQLQNILAHGVIAGSAQNGKVSGAARADYAAAAAAALLGKAKTNSIYELAGSPFTMAELAATITKASGKKVEYKDMPAPDYQKMLLGFGLPAPVAEMLADSDVGIVRGDLYSDRDDLKNLIGRPASTVDSVLKTLL
ncbi:NAD(P)-dependent oxidoreductase [Bdellovibrio bacteriovorus]|uniref:NAD(P)-dependent oxidoreductase n=1 Tax=Bdellovibrio bacteriovorus TaxID=959 RepID=A0A150WQM6_BDEBC|nr:SDR family oxidoreductase [Bdellovibrio bacteriovorus]KYG66505.1 NAD(P)-dependent oxidoreductase [Bdellovibrio bacteriovorus]